MFLQLAAASFICIYYALKKKRKERRWWQTQLYTAGKCTAVQVCWQTLIFSRSVGYIRISPECLPVNMNFY